VLRARVRTGRLRRRLAVAFVVMTAVASGALAGGSYFLVRHSWLRDSLHRAALEARVELMLASGTTFAQSGFDTAGFVQAYEARGVHAVLIFPSGRVASDPRVDPRLPSGLERLTAAGQLGFARLNVAGVPYLVVGGKAPNSDGVLYFFSSEGGIQHDLRQLAEALTVGWLIVVAVSAGVGMTVARRTLLPVATASVAARSIAEGLLETRLPTAGGDEFAMWAESFNEMADALESQMAALSEAHRRERRFTADVAHELRTPLTALVAEASLLRAELDHLPVPARRPAELLIADVGRLRTLVEELMEVSRLDAAHQPVCPASVDLRALTVAVLRLRGLADRVPVRGDDALVYCDPRSLERILTNLIDNAVEHGGDQIRITLRQDPGFVSLEVADDGPGIAPDHLPHLFERFYKADPSRTAPGSGLGLAIALEHARLINGNLSVRSELGRGTAFVLRLPGDQRGAIVSES
jgi:signal transduction histidine kinase